MDHAKFILRAGSAEDVPAMLALHHAAVHAVAPEYYPAAILAAWSPPADERRRSWLAALVTNAERLCVVATTADGRLAGFVMAELATAMLRSLYVHPDFAGQGCGRALLAHLEERCRAAGVATLALNASRNAEAFYRRNGYESLGPTTQELADGLAMGAVRMSKRLTHS